MREFNLTSGYKYGEALEEVVAELSAELAGHHCEVNFIKDNVFARNNVVGQCEIVSAGMFYALDVLKPDYIDCYNLCEYYKDIDIFKLIDIYITIKSLNTGRSLSCSISREISHGTLTIEQDVLDIIEKYHTILNELYATIVEFEKLDKPKRLEAKRQAAELKAKEEEAALVAKKKAEEEAKIIKAVESFRHCATTRNKTTNPITNEIDWLRENTRAIYATIPSRFEETFYDIFGDQPCYIIDSNKKTSSGNSMKYAPSFKLILNKDARDIPESLIHREYVNSKNEITSTPYIASLILDYGFKFTDTKRKF